MLTSGFWISVIVIIVVLVLFAVLRSWSSIKQGLVRMDQSLHGMHFPPMEPLTLSGEPQSRDGMEEWLHDLEKPDSKA